MAFLVKGMAAACLDFAPMILPPNNIVQVGSGVLWVTITVGCMVGAGPVVAAVGTKRALFVGMALFDAFYVLFTVCALLGPCPAQWPLFVLGMFLLGLGGSLLLTAICIYMAKVAALLAEESPDETLAELTTHLGGSLAMWSLGTEVIFKLAASAMNALDVPYWAAIALWATLGVVCTLLFLLAREAPEVAREDDDAESEPSAAAEVFAFFSLWSDPKLWLLGFTNFTFSFTDSLMLNYVNPHYVAPMLGESSIGLAMACVSLVGAALAKPYSFVAAYACNAVIVFVAAASFAAIPLFVLFTDLCTQGGWWVLLLYVCYGSGRAVTEGLNRAIFAEYFPGRLLDPAFANYNFQGSALSAASNLAQTVVSKEFLLYTSLSLAAATTPCYLLSACLREPEGNLNETASDGADASSAGESEP